MLMSISMSCASDKLKPIFFIGINLTSSIAKECHQEEKSLAMTREKNTLKKNKQTHLKLIASVSICKPSVYIYL